MRHLASEDFWKLYVELPDRIQTQADRCYALLKIDPKHPSLHFKKVGRYHSVRVGLKYRALAIDIPEGLLWFWIGPHSEYDYLIIE